MSEVGMNRVLIIFLVIAYFNLYLGCTLKFVTIPYDEIDKTSSQSTLKVMVTDSTEILFESGMYRFLNDTLEGTTKINGESQQIKLMKSEIQSVEILTNDSQKLVGIFIILAGFTALGYLIIVSQIDPGLR